MSNLTPETLELDPGRISIMSGWLVYDVGYHTCGGYGPESGYAHEPGCGAEPICEVADIPDLLAAAEERDEIAGRLAHLLCDLTGGRMSKTSYPVPVMAQEIEQYLSECHESDLKDERDALAAKLDTVRALHQAYVCEECREDPSGGACRENPSCEACESMTYPCATIRALDGES